MEGNSDSNPVQTDKSTEPEEKKQIVNIETVEADETGVDYDKLIKDFGCHKISPEQILKIEDLTKKKAH